MQKNQNFSCLFRHYAKHNGLRREDLIFSFVDELLPDQTPEGVHLMPQGNQFYFSSFSLKQLVELAFSLDEIYVEHRKTPKEPVEEKPSHTQFYSDHFRLLLEEGIHSDIKFLVDNKTTEVKAHKAILSARCDYFRAMFQEGGMLESQLDCITVNHDSKSFKRMLEFLYTNYVKDIDSSSSEEVISLLMMANEYLLEDLRILCEKRAAKMINVDNVSKLFLLSAGHNASVLREACGSFVEENKLTLVKNPIFRQEIEYNPELGLLLFESSVAKVNLVGDDVQGSGKKRKRNELGLQDTDIEEGQESTNTNTIAQSNASVQDY